MDVRTIIVMSETEPEAPDPPPEAGWEWNEANRDFQLWWNPTTYALKRWNSETESYDIDVEFLHPDGLTGTKVIDGKQLTFTNGILTGYEVV